MHNSNEYRNVWTSTRENPNPTLSQWHCQTLHYSQVFINLLHLCHLPTIS